MGKVIRTLQIELVSINISVFPYSNVLPSVAQHLDIEQLFIQAQLKSFRTFVRILCPVLVALMVLSTWDQLSSYTSVISIGIVIGTLFCFFSVAIFSFTSFSNTWWYTVLTAFVQTNCFLGIIFSSNLDKEFMDNLYPLFSKRLFTNVDTLLC